MNFSLLVRYLWLLLQTRGLQWAYVRVRVTEMNGRGRVHRAHLKSHH